MLIAARAVQGIGAALMTPQTLAFITAPSRRTSAARPWACGAASPAWPPGRPDARRRAGRPAGLEVDLLHQRADRRVAFVLALCWCPTGSRSTGTRSTSAGILFSGLGLLLIVFGVQNGQQYDWGSVGRVTVFEIIGAGVLLLVVFVSGSGSTREPLLPLQVFSNRNFSAACSRDDRRLRDDRHVLADRDLHPVRARLTPCMAACSPRRCPCCRGSWPRSPGGCPTRSTASTW